MPDVRPERRVLLELEQLLGLIEGLAAEGDRYRYDSDDRYRWVIHRIWIAIGNEAQAYLATITDQHKQPWYGLYLFRNVLAHRRLPEIDEDEVWRMTTIRPIELRKRVQNLLR